MIRDAIKKNVAREELTENEVKERVQEFVELVQFDI